MWAGLEPGRPPLSAAAQHLEAQPPQPRLFSHAQKFSGRTTTSALRPRQTLTQGLSKLHTSFPSPPFSCTFLLTFLPATHCRLGSYTWSLHPFHTEEVLRGRSFPFSHIAREQEVRLILRSLRSSRLFSALCRPSLGGNRKLIYLCYQPRQPPNQTPTATLSRFPSDETPKPPACLSPPSQSCHTTFPWPALASCNLSSRHDFPIHPLPRQSPAAETSATTDPDSV